MMVIDFGPLRCIRLYYSFPTRLLNAHLQWKQAGRCPGMYAQSQYTHAFVEIAYRHLHTFKSLLTCMVAADVYK